MCASATLARVAKRWDTRGMTCPRDALYPTHTPSPEESRELVRVATDLQLRKLLKASRAQLAATREKLSKRLRVARATIKALQEG